MFTLDLRKQNMNMVLRWCVFIITLLFMNKVFATISPCQNQTNTCQGCSYNSGEGIKLKQSIYIHPVYDAIFHSEEGKVWLSQQKSSFKGQIPLACKNPNETASDVQTAEASIYMDLKSFFSFSGNSGIFPKEVTSLYHPNIPSNNDRTQVPVYPFENMTLLVGGEFSTKKDLPIRQVFFYSKSYIIVH